MKVHLKTATIGQVSVGGDATIGGVVYTVLDRDDLTGIAEDTIPCFNHTRKRVEKLEDDTSVDGARSEIALESVAEGGCFTRWGRAYIRSAIRCSTHPESKRACVNLETGEAAWIGLDEMVTPEASLEVRGEATWSYVRAREVPNGRRLLWRGEVRIMADNEPDGQGDVQLEELDLNSNDFLPARRRVYLLD